MTSAQSPDPREGTTATRRHLLGAAGGFALVASGLLVPDWLIEEGEAADRHPVRGVQQRKEQRRKKHRNERSHHHDRHRRRDGGTKPPELGPKGIRLKVVNETDHSFNSCQHWVGTIGWYRNSWENLGKQGSATSTFTEDTEELHAGVLFPGGKEAFVWVENPFAGTPNTTYQSGGTFSPFGYKGGPPLSITAPWRRVQRLPIALTSPIRAHTRSKFVARMTSPGSSFSR